MRGIFSKKGRMRFVSHLDLVRLFQRASRRAALPVTVTKGFNPHLRISISKALKLGIESDGEEVIFYFDKTIEPERFRSLINDKLPEGIRFEKAERIY